MARIVTKVGTGWSRTVDDTFFELAVKVDGGDILLGI